MSELNPEQQAVINAGEGVYSVLAGPGAGKSHCLVQRYIRLIESGEKPEDCLTLTFTNSAAKSMRDRAAVQKTDDSRGGWMTFHALALQFCLKEREHFGFELAEFPLCPEPLANKICWEIARRFEVQPRPLRNYISLQKRNRLRPHESLKRAEAEHKDEKLALAYKTYETKLRENKVLDFDGLLLEMVDLLEKDPSILNRWSYKWIAVDEAQDCCSQDWTLIKLLSQKHGNILAVGDPGQCQPEGTLVSVPSKVPRTRRDIMSDVRVPIEDIKPGDKVVTWQRKTGRTIKQGQIVKNVGVRDYAGDILTITCNGSQTRVTADHKLWATLAENCRFQYLVYLMYRRGFGFRVGMCRTAVYRGNRNGLGGFSSRCYEERAEKAWILGVYETSKEAHSEELIKAAQYGIPTCVFESQGHHKVDECTLRNIFKAVPLERGLICLVEHNLSFRHPILDRLSGKPNSRYFQIVAANIIPELMKLPTTEAFTSAVVENITREHCHGLVYSLDVARDHTYIADGIPVCNCIYSFRGSSPEDFETLEQRFPVVHKLYLGCNFRSTPEIVNFVQKVGPVPDLAEKFHTHNLSGPEPTITRYDGPAQEAADIARIIKKRSGGGIAVLARTNRAIRPMEDALASLGVKYRLLGKSGFYQQPEIKSVVAYLQCAIFPADYAIGACLRSSFWPTKYLKKSELTAKIKARPEDSTAISLLRGEQNENTVNFVHFLDSLRKYRDLPSKEAVVGILKSLKAIEHYTDEDDPDNSPVENLQELIRISSRFSSLKEFLDYIRRASAASKSKKAVALSTCHGAKGLEFNTVFLIQAAEGILPHAKAESVEEEKCVFFVACSRAERELHLSYSGQPSRFLTPFLKEKEDEHTDV